MGLVLNTLNDIRAHIAADDEVLEEARARHSLVVESAMGLAGTLRRFSSGSLAHGTVNAPVTDADNGRSWRRPRKPGAGAGPASPSAARARASSGAPRPAISSPSSRAPRGDAARSAITPGGRGSADGTAGVSRRSSVRPGRRSAPRRSHGGR